LVRAAQQGDRKAFDSLVRAHERLLRAFLAKRAGPQAADDILQETWMAAWVSLPSFRGRSRFKAWLFQVALHKCADQRRSTSSTIAEPLEEDLPDDGDGRISPYAAVEMRHLVGEALDALPEGYRTLLELYYFAELTLPEIAATLDRNLNTVKYQFYKAHDRISTLLTDYAPDRQAVVPTSRDKQYK